MRTLKYAILGLINREPATGYDITKEFNSNNLANFWYAKHSQVYPELNKLLKEELVTYQIVIQGEKLEKKIYTITEKGKEEFYHWLLTDYPLEPTPKDIFRLRIYFSEYISNKDLKRHFESQKKKHLKRKEHLNHVLVKQYGEGIPPLNSKEGGDYMVLEGAILREKANLQWLDNCLGRLKTEAYTKK